MSCNLSETDSLENDDQGSGLLQKTVLSNTDLYNSLSHKSYDFHGGAQLLAVQVSESTLEVLTLQCSSTQSQTLDHPIITFRWLTSAWVSGEVCLVVSHVTGVSLWWLDTSLTPSPRTTLQFFVWKDLPGVLSVVTSRAQQHVDLVTSREDKLVMVFREQVEHQQGGVVMVCGIGRLQDLIYYMSVTISDDDRLGCLSLYNDHLYIFISFQLIIYDVNKSKIVFKLDMNEIMYLSRPARVMGNDRSVVVVDESHALHRVMWTQAHQRVMVSEDPWATELERIENMGTSQGSNVKPVVTVMLHQSICDMSFYPDYTSPSHVIMTSHLVDTHTTYLLYSLTLDSLTSSLTLPGPSLLLTPEPFPCGVTPTHLYYIVPGLDIDPLLDDLLVFRSAEVASSLSLLNDKPTDMISHSSLSHALTYQQIESVSFCLNKVLSGGSGIEEVLETCQELVTRCSEAPPCFSRQVAKLGANFINQAISLDTSETALPRYMSQLRAILFRDEEEDDDTICSSEAEEPRVDQEEGIVPPEWGDLAPKQVVKRAVLTGDVALGEYYLLNTDTDFEVLADEVLIELLKDKSMLQARQIMAHTMTNGNSKLKDVCVSTDDVALCTYLFSELPPNLLTKEEVEGERFLRTMQLAPAEDGGEVVPLRGVSSNLSLQLNWVIGWDKAKQDLLLYEQQYLTGSSHHPPKEISKDTQIQLRIWKDKTFLETCDIHLLSECYMSEHYFFTPYINQYTIQNRMVNECNIECSLPQFIEAYLDKPASGQVQLIKHPVFEKVLLTGALDQELYTLVILHLQHDKFSDPSLGQGDPIFSLIESYVRLSRDDTEHHMYEVLVGSLAHISPDLSQLSLTHPLAVLAALLYSPHKVLDSLANAVSNPVSNPVTNPAPGWCDPALLRQGLAPYPRLHSILFPDQTEEGSQVPGVTTVLHEFETWNTFQMVYPAFKSFTDPDLVSGFGVKTTADYSFYLATGRPFYAYMSILNMPVLHKDEVVREIYQAALHHASDTTFVGSSVIVTELLCKDCTDIVVDIQVVRLLKKKSEWVRQKLLDNDITEVIPVLSEALRRGKLPRFEGQLLLHLFCKRGSLDIACHHDSWLDLVWNLHAWQIEKTQALQIVRKCAPSLRGHMKQIIYRMEEKTHGALDRPRYLDCCDLFGKVTSYLGLDNGTRLSERLCALTQEMPVVAILSYSFGASKLQAAMVAWIKAELKDQTAPDDLSELLLSMAGARLPVLHRALQIFHPKCELLPLIQLSNSLHNITIPDKLSSQTLRVLETWQDLLFPDVHVVKEFIFKMLAHLITSPTTNFEQFFAINHLAHYSFKALALVPNYDRLSLLREVLQEARLTLRLHHETPEAMYFTKSELHRSINTALYEEEARGVLERMIEQEQYDLARKFAQIAGFNTADAVFSQIKNQLKRFKASGLWKSLPSRLNFWGIIQSRFELFLTELHDRGPILRAKFYFLEGCNNYLCEIERAYLISQGLSAVLAGTKPIISKPQAERLLQFYWSTVANAYLNKEPPVTTFFHPLETTQDWELCSASEEPCVVQFPKYQYDLDEEVVAKIGDFVEQFLRIGYLQRAERLTKLFGLKNQDLEIVRTCLVISEEYVTLSNLPSFLKSVIKEKYTIISPTTLVLATEQGNRQRIEEWSYKKRVRTVSSKFEVTTSTYSYSSGSEEGAEGEGEWQVPSKTPREPNSKDWAALDEIYIGDLLATYITSGTGLCELFSTFYKLSKEEGMMFRHNKSPMKHLEMLLRNKVPGSILKQYVAFRNISPHEVVVLIVKITRKWMDMPTFAKDLPLSEFKKLADLVSDQYVNKLAVQLWDDILPRCSLENLLKLLLFAYHCFTRGNCSDGRMKVLEFCKAKAPILASAGFCQQLVELFFEADQFSEMTYICDLVYSHNKFSLFIQHPGASKKPHFQSAVLTYLQQQQPQDLVNREALCLTFNKHLEIAKLHHGRAAAMLSDKTKSLTVERLEECVKGLRKAARHYKLDQAFDKHILCVKQARLVSLQLLFKRSSSNSSRNVSNVLNISKDEVRNFLLRHISFFESFIVAEAYNVTDLVPFVFRMAVIEENMDYFEDYRTIHCIDSSFFEDICINAQRSRRLDEAATRNLIGILSHCKNVRLRKSIAQKLSLPTNMIV